MIADAADLKDEHMTNQPNTLTDLLSAASQAQAACNYEAALSFYAQALETGDLSPVMEYALIKRAGGVSPLPGEFASPAGG